MEDLHKDRNFCFSCLTCLPFICDCYPACFAGALPPSEEQPCLISLKFLWQAIDGLLVWYLVSYVFVMMVVGLVSFLIRRTHELHVHHYLFGFFASFSEISPNRH